MLSHNIGTPRFRVTEAPHGHTSPQSLWQGRRHGQLHTRFYSFHSVHWPKQDTRSHFQGGQESTAWQVPRGGGTKTSAQGHGDHGQASSRKGCHSLRENANRKRQGRSGGEERLSWVDSLGASYHPTLATGTQLSLIKRSECLVANNQLVLLASLNSKQSSRLVLIASESAWAAINKSHHRPVA